MEVVKILIQYKIKIDGVDNDGNTGMHYAVSNRNV